MLGTTPAARERQAARRIEELGYGSLWVAERIGGKEAFARQSVPLGTLDQAVAQLDRLAPAVLGR